MTITRWRERRVKRRPVVRKENGDRKGGAAVELAVCLPLIIFLFLSAVDTANTVFLKQTATAAAYEAARVATSIGGTEQMATSRAQEILTARDVADSQIDIEPAITPETPRGTTVTVTVMVPSDANSLGVGSLFRGRQVIARSAMVRL